MVQGDHIDRLSHQPELSVPFILRNYRRTRGNASRYAALDR